MRILLYVLNYSPELTGIGKYTGEMADWLTRRGHEVRVITAYPHYPAWKIPPEYVPWKYTSENDCGVQVFRCPVWIPSRLSGLKRILHLTSFAISSLPVVLRQYFWKPECVMIVEPTFFCAPQAAFLAWLCRCTAWLHIQDYEIDVAFDLGLLRGKFLKFFVHGVERLIMRRFDRVSGISQPMVDRSITKGVAAHRTFLFPNWVDVETIRPQKTSSYRNLLGIPEQATVVLYSGYMGAKQNMDLLAEVARLCIADTPELWFVFCGQGPDRGILEDACSELPCVSFLEVQPTEKLGELLNLADIHVLPQRMHTANLVMPSKLTGMLASGRPVVGTARSETELGSLLAACGILVEVEDAQAFSRAILELAGNATLRAALGQAGRAYAEASLAQKSILKRFEDALFFVTPHSAFESAVSLFAQCRKRITVRHRMADRPTE